MKTKQLLLALTAGLVFAATAQAELIYGVTNTQTLVSFDSASPGAILTGVPLSGLASNETIRGIDFRPLTGELFALGSFSNLYKVDTATGKATSVAGMPFSPGLNGSAFGFDFNPTIDRIRVVSDANQNMVLNPITGMVQLNATPLFYPVGDANEGKDPNVVGSAYNNNFVPTPTSQLFGIDTGLDILVKQANNTGVLTTVGGLGADITTLVGFDISGFSGIAYAASQEAGNSISMLWQINLDTGAATKVGEIGGGLLISGIALPVPAPASGALLGVAAIAAMRRRR
jgi:Domain of unknown function (DUF4394)